MKVSELLRIASTKNMYIENFLDSDDGRSSLLTLIFLILTEASTEYVWDLM